MANFIISSMQWSLLAVKIMKFLYKVSKIHICLKHHLLLTGISSRLGVGFWDCTWNSPLNSSIES